MASTSDSCPSGVLCLSYPLVIFTLVVVMLLLSYFHSKYITSSTGTTTMSSASSSSSTQMPPVKIYIESKPGANSSRFIDENPPLGPPGRRLNIRTRGPLPDTQQVGILTSATGNSIPLYGRPTYAGSSRWNYFTSDDKFNQMKLPVEFKHRNCMKEECDEVMEDDRMFVPSQGKETHYNVTLYPLDAPKYIPYIL